MAETLTQVAVGAAINVGLSFLFQALKDDPVNESGKVSSLQITTAQEGAPLRLLYGHLRTTGNIIWATEFVESHNADTGYHYTCSFAVAFCEGAVGIELVDIFANDVRFDLYGKNYRFYTGTTTQTPDPKIQAVEGTAYVPAYRNVCYIVFEDLNLDAWGGSLPSISAELMVPPATRRPDDLANLVRGVDLLPGAVEWLLAPDQVSYAKDPISGGGWDSSVTGTFSLTVHGGFINASMDSLLTNCPNAGTVAIVVSWYGDDLRCEHCTIEPRQENSKMRLRPTDWSVGSYGRSNTRIPSKLPNGELYFGGTPADWTLIECIDYLQNTRGLKVVLYPFITMDVPPTNTLANPYSDNASGVGQAVFPWRGRITTSPAPGYVGAVDKTSGATSQISNFISQFNAFIMHYATLAGVGDKVDYFIIGSEMVGMTTARNAVGSYPFADNLVTLAASVKAAVHGGCRVGYGADWSEQVHECADGLWFHLDPLWASSGIDFVGIDNYLPLADWRDNDTHLDYDASLGYTSTYNHNYLKSQVEGGEYYDYYYANYNDRVNQVRTPITDGAYSKPWVFRRKDFRNWWSHQHYNRPAWVEDSVPTGWTPYSKRVMFTEIGCPSVNKGANQPNVFYDPKSSESFFPYFSTGVVDNIIQRNFLESFLAYWRDNNPVQSGVPTNYMLDVTETCIWAWDARAYPNFPGAGGDWWGDSANWKTGHWLTGKVGATTLIDVVYDLCIRSGLTTSQFDVDELDNTGTTFMGFVIDSITTARTSIQNLSNAHMFDAVETNGVVKFKARSTYINTVIPLDDIIVTNDNSSNYTITKGQYSEIPSIVEISYVDIGNNYQKATVRGGSPRGYGGSVQQLDLPEVLSTSYCMALADSLVEQSWSARNTGEIKLPLSYIALDPGDIVRIGNSSLRITNKIYAEHLTYSYTSYDNTLFTYVESRTGERSPKQAQIFGTVSLRFVDIPLITGTEVNPASPRLAAYSDPWPNAVNVHLFDGVATYDYITQHTYLNVLGMLMVDLPSGSTDRWDRTNSIQLDVLGGQLTSITEDELLVSTTRNCVALQNSDGQWEIIGYTTATLQPDGSYILTGLLRGMYDTGYAMRNNVLAGAWAVFIDVDKFGSLPLSRDVLIQSNVYKYGPAPYNITASAYQTQTFQGNCVGLVPFTPTQAYLAKNSATNDLTINWTRQTRFGGVSWELAEVPLNEDFEQYRLRIYNGVTLAREIIVNSVTSYVYTSAMQVTDFGSNPTTLAVTIAQYGTSYGNYGRELTQTLTIKSVN